MATRTSGPHTAEEHWLSVAHLSKELDASVFVITGMLQRAEIPAIKVGREWRVHPDDFTAWVETQKTIL
jgi:excisionase family DNA binding protein